MFDFLSKEIEDVFGILEYLPGETSFDCSTITEVLTDLQNQNINPAIIPDIDIYLFTGRSVQIRSLDNPTYGAALHRGGTYKIILGKQHPYFKNNFLHELGHIILFHNKNDVLQDYATIRRYPYSLDKETQGNLESVDEIHEWFAEDFKFIFAYQDIGNSEYLANTTAPSLEVINFIKQLVLLNDQQVD